MVFLLAIPVSAQTDSDGDSLDFMASLIEQSCHDLEDVFYRQIPRYVYDDQSDELYALVLYLDDRCSYGEPIMRIKILASIWDGNFQEIVYGYEVINNLMKRYDVESLPSLSGARAAFDAFTSDFANQMLPHMEPGSLEEFFCLYYGGQPDRAWQILADDGLDDTWLRYYYDEKTITLENQTEPYFIGVHWGGWQPRGDMEFVGGKHLVGMTVEQWGWLGFWRFVMEGRVGRADHPYFVSEEGIEGYSDRWNAILIGGEFGVGVWRQGPHLLEAFVGLGYDGIRPFKDEEVAPAGLNLNFGTGYRWSPAKLSRWFVRADGRYEVVGSRNREGTSLSGNAFSARIGVGFRLGENIEPDLRALGRTP